MTRVDTAVDYLLKLQRFADSGKAAYRPGLERIGSLLEALGNPHEAYRICHVAGTNGKGSTASMVAAILTASGMRTGLHTSPHLLHVTERMRVDGRPADETWLADAVQRYRAVFDDVGPSFFEATVALSFLYFAEQGVDAAVVEVGLGGRLDATNVVMPEVSVITNVDLDHTDILGAATAVIAAEKAGIIKPGVPAVSGVTDPAASEVIARVATQLISPLITLDAAHMHPVSDAPPLSFTLETSRTSYGEIRMDLAGAHQIANARLAVLAAEQMLPDLKADVVKNALEDVRSLAGLRGRLEEIEGDPPIIIDVAHNAAGITAAVAYARRKLEGRKLGVVLALMKDKDINTVAAVLAEQDVLVRTITIESDRARLPDEVVDGLRRFGISASTSPDLGAALADLSDAGAILIVGSHLLAADALEMLASD